MRLLVIDGNSIANRAFFGIKLLTNKDGRYTNAIYGFLTILLAMLKECQPDEVAVAFDLKAPTFRHKMYDGYKANRHGMPDELAQQMPVLKELLADLGYRQVAVEGWEADDILGTLAAACAARRDDCFLATGDRDSLQLVSESTTVLLASTVMGKSKTLRMDPDAIAEKYGVSPRQLIDVKSLMGDTSDNIPGVKGIGEKTALALVQKFGGLDGVYEHIEDPAIKPKQRENLLACRESAELSRVLGTIRTDAPIETAEGAYKVGEGDKPAAVRLLQELEIHSLISRLGLEGVAPAAPKGEEKEALPEAGVKPLPEALSGSYLLALRPAVVEKQGSRKVVTRPEQWYAVQETTVYPLEDADLLRLLDAPGVRLEVFDSAPLYARAMAAGGWGSAIGWDGKLAAYLLDASAARYQVGELAASYRAKPAFSCPDWPDAGQLASLFETMKAEITARGEDPLYDEIEFPLAQVLADMTRLGVLVDRAGIEEFGAVMRAKLDEALARIRQQVDDPDFNPNSPKQLGEMLFDKLGLPHGKKTQTGWATDAATLEKLREDSPLVEDILEYRTYQKLNSTYVEGLLKVIGPDGRIHSTFNQTEARTGRLSSDNPNLQNIPIRTELGSRLRAYFVARPGWVLVDADYSQIELRILAHITGDEHMQEAFRSGADIHRSTAAKIYGLPLEAITPRLRSSAKAINFGIMYGKGAFSLSKDIGVTVKEADAFLRQYLDTFPKVSGYMEKTIADAKANGYVSTLFGRRRALPELSSSNFNVRSSGERMARNTPIQGTAADVIKLAMVRVWRRLRDEGMESRLILTVHDELIVEAPEQEADKAARILKEEMEGCVHYAVPLETEVGRGRNWLEAH
ncbi:MAG: DNA polymerase I [Candidatus Faecalibacterium intestinavium]|uniref:DNA polymerase I n=1 Tax=Candidatus Faecalibacterium intestinavium TaxID=2838580 RepID=A0A9E2NQL7_9FIRM|nr:DNA polymerase I [Candidatus Faecalibacterium intestinavium]